MKVCNQCGLTKTPDEYHRDRNRADGRHSTCKACRCTNSSVRSRAWRAAHPDEARSAWRADYTKRYADKRARIVSLKLTLQCVDCGWSPSTDSEVSKLEFDHKDPATKHTLKSRAAFRYSWSWARIMRELALCEPRCKPCHTKRSARQRALPTPRRTP